MNNKRGGVGAKILLVLILMIASAVAGAYGYRILDGKMAVKDAIKEIEDVDIDDYDTADSTTIKDYIDEATNKVNAAKSRREVYELLEDFGKDISRVKTKTEKEAEALLEKAQQAQEKNSSQTEDEYGQGYDEDEGTDGLQLFKSKNEKDTEQEEEESSGGLFNFS